MKIISGFGPDVIDLNAQNDTTSTIVAGTVVYFNVDGLTITATPNDNQAGTVIRDIGPNGGVGLVRKMGPYNGTYIPLSGGGGSGVSSGSVFIFFPDDTALNAVNKPLIVPAAATLLSATIWLNDTEKLTGSPAAQLKRFAAGTPDTDLLSDGDNLITAVAFPVSGSLIPITATIVEDELLAGDMLFPAITGGGTYTLGGFPVIVLEVSF